MAHGAWRKTQDAPFFLLYFRYLYLNSESHRIPRNTCSDIALVALQALQALQALVAAVAVVAERWLVSVVEPSRTKSKPGTLFRFR
jgi:hypothetical protein